MDPSGFTALGWQAAQDAALAGNATGTWPVGGMPWQETQVSFAVSVQRGTAFVAPVTPLKLKLPWQYEAAQPAVPATQVGAAPPAFAIGPKTTFWAGGLVAWANSVGTTWHSTHATGTAAELAAAGFKWAMCAPMA